MKLYNYKHELLAHLDDLNPSVDKVLGGISTLSFTINKDVYSFETGQLVSDERYDLVINERLVEYDNELYVIKDSVPCRDEQGVITKEVVCKHISIELSSTKINGHWGFSPSVEHFQPPYNKPATLQNALNDLFENHTNGWELGVIPNLEKYRTFEFEWNTPMEIIVNLSEIYDFTPRFRTEIVDGKIKKYVDILTDEYGEIKGYYRHDSTLNTIRKPINSDGITTRLYVFGYNDISINEISSETKTFNETSYNIHTFGQSYVDNFDYFLSQGYTYEECLENFVRVEYIKDDLYVDPYDLYDFAKEQVSKVGMPTVSYTVDINDIEFEHKPELELGHKVRIYDKDLNIDLIGRVSKISFIHDAPEAKTIEIANYYNYLDEVDLLTNMILNQDKLGNTAIRRNSKFANSVVMNSSTGIVVQVPVEETSTIGSDTEDYVNYRDVVRIGQYQANKYGIQVLDGQIQMDRSDLVTRVKIDNNDGIVIYNNPDASGFNDEHRVFYVDTNGQLVAEKIVVKDGYYYLRDGQEIEAVIDGINTGMENLGSDVEEIHDSISEIEKEQVRFEELTKAENIIATVTQSKEYIDDLLSKVDSTILEEETSRIEGIIEAATSVDKIVSTVTNSEKYVQDLLAKADSVALEQQRTELEGIINTATSADRIITTVTESKKYTDDLLAKADYETVNNTIDNVKTELQGKIDSVEGVANQATLDIQKTNESLTLKANKTEVYTKTETDNALSGKANQSSLNGVIDRVTATESTLEVQAGQIASKVEKKTYETEIGNINNSLSGKVDVNTVNGIIERVTEAESSITQNAEQIATKVSNTTYQQDKANLESRVTNAESSITQNSEQITLKANKTDVYTKGETDNKVGVISEKVSAVESSLDIQAGQIAAKVSKTDYEKDMKSVGTRLSSAESSIIQNAESITSKVSKTEYEQDQKGITDRLSTAESSITQQAGEIALKASKTELQTGLNSKADNSTVSTLSGKVSTVESELKVQADQIKQTVTKTEYEGSIEELQDAISNKADNSEIAKLSGRLTTAESSITQNANAIQQKVSRTEYETGMSGKADNSAVNNLANRVTNTETTLTQQANEIALKASKTEVYTKAETDNKIDNIQIGGINLIKDATFSAQPTRWEGISSSGWQIDVENKLDEINSVRIHRTGLTSNSWAELRSYPIEVESGEVYTGSFYVKCSGLDGVYDYVILALWGYSETGERHSLCQFNLSKDYSKWERIVFTATIPQGVKTLKLCASSRRNGICYLSKPQLEQGNKVTSWNSAPSDTFSKIESVEAQLTVQANEIAAKVSKTDYQKDLATIGTRLSNAESSITQTAESIEQKVSKVDYENDKDDIITRLETAETSITQNANEIALKASKTEVQTGLANKADNSTVTGLANRVSTAESSIRANAEAITQTVKKTTYDGDIKELTDAISDKANQSDLSSLANRVSTAESQITQTSEQIQQKVSKTEYDKGLANKADNSTVNALGTRLSTAETTLTQQANSIALKANKSDVYTKGETDAKVSAVESELQVQANAITQRVTKTDYTKDKTAMEERLSTAEAKIITNADSIKQTVTKTEWTSDKQTINNAIAGKADNSTVNALSGRMSTAETSITSLSNQISLKASKTDVYTKDEVNNIVDDIQIGGSNLLAGTKDFTIDSNRVNGFKFDNTNYTLTKDDEGFTVLTTHNRTGATSNIIRGYHGSYVPCQIGDTFTISMWIKVTDNSVWDVKNPYIWETFDSTGNTRVEYKDVSITHNETNKPTIVNNKWIYMTSTHTVNNANSVKCSVRLTLFRNGQIAFKKVKIEKGNKSSDWSPSASDLINRIESAEAEIQVNADSITQTVKKTDYTGEKLVSMINQTADTVKIAAKNIQLNGAVTFTSFDSSTQNKITTIENTANSASTAAGKAQTSANTAQQTANNAQSTANTAVNKIDNLKVGGRNYFLNSDFSTGTTSNWSANNSTTSIIEDSLLRVKTIKVVTTASGQGIYQATANRTSTIEDDYMLSVTLKGTAGQKVHISFEKAKYATHTFTGDWEIFELNLPRDKFSTWNKTVTFYAAQAGTMYLTKALLTTGNKIVDWIPAPEDTTLEINNAKNAASNAQSAANNAQSTANTASQNASNAVTTANSASSTATTAKNTADSAKSTANTAQSTANTANSNATTAVNTANNASSVASTAQSTANTAKSTADSAKTEAANANSKVDNLEIGGRNLVQKSIPKEYTGFTGITNDCQLNYVVLTDELESGKNITMSFVFEYENLTKAENGSIRIQGSGDVTGWSSGSFPFSTRIGEYINWGDGNSGSFKVVKTTTLNDSHVSNSLWNTNFRCDYITGGTIRVKEFKVEKGNKSTSYTVAPEDVTANINTAQNAANNAQQTASTANNTANTANTNASNAVTTANKANSTASSANTTAQSAQSTANTANSNATTAINTANNASSTAQSANTNATTAINTANTANTTAQNANSKIDNLEIGGTNLIRNTKAPSSLSYWVAGTGFSIAASELLGENVFKIVTTASSTERYGQTVRYKIEPNTTYTFSADVYMDANVTSLDVFFLSRPKGNTSDYTNIHHFIKSWNTTKSKWVRIKGKFTTKADDYEGYIRIDNNGSTNASSLNGLWFTKVQLEKGAYASDWSICQSDVDTTITTAQNAANNAQQTANTANTNASNAVSTANTAKNTATSAQTTANTASTNATNAVTTANKANTTAATANTNATTALNTANNANTTATTANNTANSANSKVDNMIIGGRNLLKNTALKDTSGWSFSSGITLDKAVKCGSNNTAKYVITGLTADAWRSATPTAVNIDTSKKYSASCEVYVPSDNGIDYGATLEVQWFDSSGTRVSTSSKAISTTTLDKWQVVKLENLNPLSTAAKANARVWVKRNGKIWVGNIKLEEGTKATSWSASQEDNDLGITNAQNAANNAQSTANTAQSTANTANTNAQTAQSTANAAQSSATNAQNTANNASSAASNAQSTANSAQSSATTANNKLNTWSHPTDSTTINGGKIYTGSITAEQIAARSITAQKLTISDFTNLCKINETANTNGNTVVTISNYKYFRFGNESTAGYYALEFARGIDSFKVGDYYKFSFTGYSSASGMNVSFAIRAMYTDGTWNNLGSTSIGVNTTNGSKSCTVKIANDIQASKTLNYVRIFAETNNKAGYVYMRNIVIKPMATSELIVDGAITANMIKSGTFKGVNFEAGGSGNSGSITVKNSSDALSFMSNSGGTYATKIGFLENMSLSRGSERTAEFELSYSGLRGIQEYGGTITPYEELDITRNRIYMKKDSQDVSVENGSFPNVWGETGIFAGGALFKNMRTQEQFTIMPSEISVAQGEERVRLQRNKISLRTKDNNGVYGDMNFDQLNEQFRIRIGGSGNLPNNGLAIQAAGDTNLLKITKTGLTLGEYNSYEKNIQMRVSNSNMTGVCGMYLNTTNFGLYDWQNSRSILQYNQSSGGIVLGGKNVMFATSANGYYGLAPNGSDNTWVRTTTSGIIPYRSGGGGGSLGTDAWWFDNVWSSSIRAKNNVQIVDAIGTCYIGIAGNGDSINYGSNNMRTRCHWGWGISDNYDNTNAVIDSRAGRFIGKSAYWHNSSKSLKSDVRVVTSETMPMALNLREYDTIDNHVTMEMIEDFLDTINIKTYVSDYNQKGVTQEEHDDSKAQITQLGYIADEFADHPLFPYIGEMIGDYHAINTTALISSVIAGYQSEKRRRLALEENVKELELRLSLIEEKLRGM